MDILLPHSYSEQHSLNILTKIEFSSTMTHGGGGLEVVLNHNSAPEETKKMVNYSQNYIYIFLMIFYLNVSLNIFKL